MPCFPSRRKRNAGDSKGTEVKYEAYAAALPAPRLFDLTGRVVVKLLQSKNAGLVIQTIGRVNRGDISSAYVFEPHIAGSGQTGQVRTVADRYSGRRRAVKTFIKAGASKEKVSHSTQALHQVCHTLFRSTY